MHAEELRLKDALVLEVGVAGGSAEPPLPFRWLLECLVPPASCGSGAPRSPLRYPCCPSLTGAVPRALQVRYDTSEPDMQQVAALFAAQMHIDGGRVRDLLHLVAATQERRRF